MVIYIANKIETTFNTQGLTAAQNKYRAYFVNTTLYLRYKGEVDTILTTDDYTDCIVTA